MVCSHTDELAGSFYLGITNGAMRFYWLILGILCVWRITHLLHVEDGPWNVFRKLRDLLGRGFWGGLLGCFNCLSLWVAPLFAYLISEKTKEFFLLWLALSGAAILIQRLFEKQTSVAPVYYYEEEEKEKE